MALIPTKSQYPISIVYEHISSLKLLVEPTNLHQGLHDPPQLHVERLVEGQSGADLERGPVGGVSGPSPVAHMNGLVEWSGRRRKVFLVYLGITNMGPDIVILCEFSTTQSCHVARLL